MERKEIKQVNPEMKRKTMSFFMLIFPSLILALIPSSFGSNVLYPLVLKIMVLFYQYFVVKFFVDSKY